MGEKSVIIQTGAINGQNEIWLEDIYFSGDREQVKLFYCVTFGSLRRFYLAGFELKSAASGREIDVPVDHAMRVIDQQYFRFAIICYHRQSQIILITLVINHGFRQLTESLIILLCSS